jgi:acyl-CoA thioesterase-1
LRFLLLALLFALAACGERPRLERLSNEAIVLAFGDSLTYGTGANENESYPAQLESLIGRKVVRAGVPGEVTAQALERLPAALDEYRPQLLLLCIGGNDFLRRLGNAQAERNVRAMVGLARSRGVAVLLIGTPELSLIPSPPAFYAAILKTCASPTTKTRSATCSRTRASSRTRSIRTRAVTGSLPSASPPG